MSSICNGYDLVYSVSRWGYHTYDQASDLCRSVGGFLPTTGHDIEHILNSWYYNNYAEVDYRYSKSMPIADLNKSLSIWYSYYMDEGYSWEFKNFSSNEHHGIVTCLFDRSTLLYSMRDERKSSPFSLFSSGGPSVLINKEKEIFTFHRCSVGKERKLCLQFLDRNSKYYTFEVFGMSSEIILGRKEWTTQKMGNMDIAMTVCNITSFTCDDGQCINQHKRCDLVRDCTDGSDEEVNCDIQPSRPPTYSEYACPITEGRPAIKLTLKSHGISGVQMNDNSIKILLEISLEWVDSRLIFKQLMQGYVYQAPTEILSKLWRPRVHMPEASFLDDLQLNDRRSLEEELFFNSSTKGNRTIHNSRESK